MKESYAEIWREAAARLSAIGYSKLLPIQEKAIPAILRGKHTLIVAPTGSGKTEAAVIPVLMMMKESGVRGWPNVVYITPLRALNRDLISRIERLASALWGFRAMVRHGDTGPSERRRFRRSPPEIVITTPESFNLLLATPEYRGFWSKVRWVIVDEIHELLESERGAELTVILQRLSASSGGRIQRIGLSATLSRRSLNEAASFLAYGKPVEIVEDRSPRSYEISVEIVRGDAGEQRSIGRLMAEKIKEISERARGSVLVFTNTRSFAEYLGASIKEVLGEDSVAIHHGSLSRSVREEAERALREGRKKLLVATSSMELGIDIGSIDMVVQVLSPRQAIAMVQRAGRSRHRYGETSRAVIVTTDNLYEVLESLVIAKRASSGVIEDLSGHKGAYDALAHQIAAMVIEGSAKSVDDVMRLIAGTHTYSEVSREEVEEVIRHLDAIRVIRFDGTSLKPSRRAKEYLYTVSMIPSERFYTVVDMVSDKVIGEVSDRFVEALLYMERAIPFILAGKAWKILEVDEERLRVTVEPIAEVSGEIPAWSGELIPVTREVAAEVCSAIASAMRGEEVDLLASAEPTISRLRDVLLKTREAWGLPFSSDVAIIEGARSEARSMAILHVCLGSRGNFALGLLLQKIMERRGMQASFEYMPYAIVFHSSSPHIAGALAASIEEARKMEPAERHHIIEDSIRDTEAYVLRFAQVARRLGLISQQARAARGILREMVRAGRAGVVEKETLREIFHEKIDMEAVNSYLSSLRDVRVLSAPHLSPLATEVLTNPYMARSYTENERLIFPEQICEIKMASLEARDVILLCLRCGHATATKVKHIYSTYRCARCGSVMIAPLPEGSWGREMVELVRARVSKSAERGKQMVQAAKSRGSPKELEQLRRMAELYAEYAGGYAKLVVMALMARGVGAERAKRIIESYHNGGKRAFCEELLRAEESYIVTRKYWDS